MLYLRATNWSNCCRARLPHICHGSFAWRHILTNLWRQINGPRGCSFISWRRLFIGKFGRGWIFSEKSQAIKRLVVTRASWNGAADLKIFHTLCFISGIIYRGPSGGAKLPIILSSANSERLKYRGTHPAGAAQDLYLHNLNNPRHLLAGCITQNKYKMNVNPVLHVAQNLIPVYGMTRRSSRTTKRNWTWISPEAEDKTTRAVYLKVAVLCSWKKSLEFFVERTRVHFSQGWCEANAYTIKHFHWKRYQRRWLFSY